jgi:dihydroorotate dehydrogenase (NAD+) catalytic subunit
MSKTKSFNPDLSVDIAGIKCKNPVIAASGTCGYGEELSSYINLSSLGAIVVKGLSLKPKFGNPPPRIVETPCGMLNSIGLENVGVDSFIKDKLPFLRKFDLPVIVNFFGNTVEEYGEVAKRLDGVSGLMGLELNISCPNVRQGGIAFGVDPKAASKVVDIVKKSSTLPLITKLSPNVTNIKSMATAVEEAGTDSISLINTLTAMVIDVETRKPKLANIVGGLSGPAIKPIAVRMVWEVCQVVKVPVIGIGGIMGAEDALEFLIAGASAIQVGTANFLDPHVTTDIVRGIGDYLKREQIEQLTDMIGSLDIS